MRSGTAPHPRPAAAVVAAATFAVAGLGLSAATPAARAAGLPVGRPVTIAWAGDTTLGSQYGLPPRRGWSQLAPTARVLGAADLTAVNLEGTFTGRGTSKCAAIGGAACFAFRAPPGNAASLARAGVDVVNLANNHAYDFGAVGQADTVSAVRRRGVGVTGRPGEILVRRVAGARVAFAGFAPYRWASRIENLAAVRAQVRRAARRANVVVALFHGGAEGADRAHTPSGPETDFGEHRGDVRAFARAAVDAGADLVLGSGPHVLRGMELYRHRVVAYSLGNFTGFHNFATGGVLSLSGILRVTVDADGSLLTGRFASLRLDGAGIPHEDRSGEAARFVSALGREDFGARALAISADGRVRPPAR